MLRRSKKHFMEVQFDDERNATLFRNCFEGAKTLEEVEDDHARDYVGWSLYTGPEDVLKRLKESTDGKKIFFFFFCFFFPTDFVGSRTFSSQHPGW